MKKINRGCTNEDTEKANYLLNQNGYKVDWHLMPDLPGSSLEKDRDMFRRLLECSVTKINDNYYKYILKHPNLPDQLKIYPCSTVDWTVIKEWYDKGGMALL